jgi:hypothetical protein
VKAKIESGRLKKALIYVVMWVLQRVREIIAEIVGSFGPGETQILGKFIYSCVI